MQNAVPVHEELADRALADRRQLYATEVRRLIDAAFAVLRQTGDLEPSVRDIVRTAGLSNQAFYRHFASKEALLLAVLADGRQQLVGYLRRRLGATGDPAEQVRRFIDGVLAQARDPEAAEATRPFAYHAARLADRFPTEVAASRAQLVDLLRTPVRALGGDEGDAELVHDLAIARMHDALVHRRAPSRREAQQLFEFCLRGITRGT